MKLKEWKDSNGNKITTTSPAVSTSSNSRSTSSGSFRKRLYRLVKYHEHQHLNDRYISIDELTTDEIKFTEHYVTKANLVYEIYIGPTTEAWKIKITDESSAIVADDVGTGWENLLKQLSYYITVPALGTADYNLLMLTEWLDSKGNKININNSSSTSQAGSSTSTALYKDKFKKLLDFHLSNDYHIKHGNSQGTIEILSEDKDKALFKFKESYENSKGSKHEAIVAAAYFKGDSTWWVVRFVDGKQKEDFIGDGFNELIKKLYRYFTLPATNSSEYQDLLEEYSIAEDFRLYENLWEDIEEEYNVILGKTKYNLYDDNSFNDFLIQSAKLMRKPAESEQPLEFFELQKINKMLRTPKYYENKKLADRLQKVKSELEQLN